MADVEAFAVAVTKKTGQSAYKSLILARKDSGIRELADLKGHTFAFVDPSSASGHLFPKAGLEQAGFEPDKLFSRVIFSGSHDASILAVANKKVDAAAVADRILANAVARGLVKQDDFQVVWSSRPIPESPMVWRKNMDPVLKQKVAAALASIKVDVALNCVMQLNSREAIAHAIAKGIGIGFVSAVEYAETPGTKPITFVDHPFSIDYHLCCLGIRRNRPMIAELFDSRPTPAT